MTMQMVIFIIISCSMLISKNSSLCNLRTSNERSDVCLQILIISNQFVIGFVLDIISFSFVLVALWAVRFSKSFIYANMMRLIYDIMNPWNSDDSVRSLETLILRTIVINSSELYMIGLLTWCFIDDLNL